MADLEAGQSGQAGEQPGRLPQYLNADFAEYQQWLAAVRADQASGTEAGASADSADDAAAEARLLDYRSIRKGPASGVFAAPGTQSDPKHENF